MRMAYVPIFGDKVTFFTKILRAGRAVALD